MSDLKKAAKPMKPLRSTAIKRSVGEILFDNLNVLFLLVFAFLTLYPFWYILVLSLNEGKDSAQGGVWFWPRKWTLTNYAYVLVNPQVLVAYRTTILRTVSGSVLALFVTGLAAYSLSKHHLPGRNLIILIFMIPMFIGGTLVSSYVLIAKLKMLNTFWVYIIPGCFSFFNAIIIRTFIYTIPVSLEESAKMDGASYFTILARIVAPLCMPIVATILLFNAVGHWLDFYTNMIYTATNKAIMTLQYLLYLLILAKEASMNTLTEHPPLQGGAFQSRREEVTPQAIKMAVIMTVTLPILFVYPFVQKYFVKGVLIGSVKE
jgi:putative aldouronate transport system permease protein